jgi:hypothetical protein
VGNELLQIARGNAHRLFELNSGEARELTLWQAEEFELRATALEGDALITGRRNFYRGRRQLSGNLREFLCRNRDRTRRFDISGHFGADRDIEIGTRDANAFLRRLNEKIGEDGKGCFGRHRRSDCREPFLEFFTRDGEAHSRTCSDEDLWIPRLLY